MSAFAEDRDLAIQFRDLRLCEFVQSAVQNIELFEHPILGKVLAINGEVQHVERWQSLYHEPLIHLASSFIPEVRDVLVLGGGSLFAASEVLRYPTVTRCTLVDHDPDVLDLMVRHYAHAVAVAGDSRFTFINRNAVEFLQTADDKYDLVVNDCFDTLRATVESGQPVFDLMSKRLSREGVCSDPVYRHVFEQSYSAWTLNELQKVNYALSLVTIPEYPGVLHLLACWGSNRISQNLHAPINEWQKRWATRKEERPKLEFYDPRFLPFYLYLPPYLQKA